MAKATFIHAQGDSGTTSLVGGTESRKTAHAWKHMALLMNSRLSSDAYYQTRHAPGGEKPAPWKYRTCSSISEVTSRHKCRKERNLRPGESLPTTHNALKDGLTLLMRRHPGLRHLCYPEDVCLQLKLTWLALYADGQRRRITTLSTIEYVDPALTAYINRLSDYLFILARYFNHSEGVEEIVWHK